MVKNALINDDVQFLDIQLDILRVKSLSPVGKPEKESPAYKPSYSVRKAVLQSPLAGKNLRPRPVFPGFTRGPLDSEDDEDSDEEDDDMAPLDQCALAGPSGVNETLGDDGRGSQSREDEEHGGVAEEDSQEARVVETDVDGESQQFTEQDDHWEIQGDNPSTTACATPDDEEGYTNDTTVGEDDDANSSDTDEESDEESEEEEETRTEEEIDTDEETDADETDTDEED